MLPRFKPEFINRLQTSFGLCSTRLTHTRSSIGGIDGHSGHLSVTHASDRPPSPRPTLTDSDARRCKRASISGYDRRTAARTSVSLVLEFATNLPAILLAGRSARLATPCPIDGPDRRRPHGAVRGPRTTGDMGEGADLIPLPTSQTVTDYRLNTCRS